MVEDENNKAGLHSKISSIPGGVLIQKNDSAQQRSGASARDESDHHVNIDLAVFVRK